MNYKVYAHINKLNGNVYIGITNQKLKGRFGKDGNGYRHGSMRESIDKYGWNNFHHILLEDNLPKVIAEKVEKELISYYKSINQSINSQSGGMNNFEVDDNWRYERAKQYGGELYRVNNSSKLYTSNDLNKMYMLDSSYIKKKLLTNNTITIHKRNGNVYTITKERP